jgi:hypothetical protein
MKAGGFKSLACATMLALFAAPALAQQADMTFFVTSTGPGKGGDLGGLAGADRQCKTLAQAAGAKAQNWHAYLSTQATATAPAVNARDRIGKGPWTNAKGVVIARDVADLHSDNNKINKETALDEKGRPVNGRGDAPPLTHDMLTGSQPDGTAFAAGADMTCGNWTSSDAGSAMLGHHDRMGTSDTAAAKSWNSSHPSRGCSPPGLASTGSGGLFYCFAAD